MNVLVIIFCGIVFELYNLLCSIYVIQSDYQNYYLTISFAKYCLVFIISILLIFCTDCSAVVFMTKMYMIHEYFVLNVCNSKVSGKMFSTFWFYDHTLNKNSV